ncbi:MAG: zf-HC2 domain-containing protein [Bacteroidota bacterium]|nr:zf-HC2 domain-containing protein [Bacteroidota bacterium]
MKCETIVPLLAEYTDGTISAEDRKTVEGHLASCEQCSRHVELIADALNTLRSVPEENVPENYFSSLVPRIRERLERRRRFNIASIVPLWVQEALAPAAALAVVASFIALFFIFEPSADNLASLSSIVRAMQNEDTTALSDYVASQNIAQTNVDAEEHVLETASDPSLVTRHFEKSAFGGLHGDVEDISVSTSLISSDPSYESLSSDEVDQVIERLSHLSAGQADQTTL